MLVSYHWPGNVRELQNVMIRAQVLSRRGIVAPEHLIFDDLTTEQVENAQEQGHLGYSNSELGQSLSAAPFMAEHSVSKTRPTLFEFNNTESLSGTMKVGECETIMAALQESKNREQAAEKLGISPRTLRHKLQRFRKDGMTVIRAYAR